MSEHPKDYAGDKMGMWLFLFTEILLFGGLFLLYAAYLHRYPAEFHAGGKTLDVLLGGLNTVALITSSLTVALSITALRLGQTRRCQLLLGVTVLLALVFLVNKYFEWTAKFGHGVYPGSEHLKQLPLGQNVFYSLYFAMTGLHGIHVIIGGVFMTLVAWRVRQAKVTPQDFVLLENAGLYWHVVDLIWIFLFPLFYLIA
jgi:cytochrome c oxidase subunit III